MDVSLLPLIGVVVVIVLIVGLVVVGSRRRPDTDVAKPEGATRASRIGRSASALGASLRRAWGGGLDEETWRELEEALLGADVGLEATTSVVAGVKAAGPETPDDARRALSTQLRAELGQKDREIHLEGEPAVILVVGVNGTGKTTTIAKLAARLKGDGHDVVLAAGDLRGLIQSRGGRLG